MRMKERKDDLRGLRGMRGLAAWRSTATAEGH